MVIEENKYPTTKWRLVCRVWDNQDRDARIETKSDRYVHHQSDIVKVVEFLLFYL